jgi:hypothetical protein
MNRVLLSVVICVFACAPSSTDAQDSVKELLEMATPAWLSARESAYYELGVRVEEAQESRLAKTGQTERFRRSRDLFASGDLKLINAVSLDPELPVDRSDATWADEHVFMRKFTAQNAQYGFVVERDLEKVEHRDLWQVKDQVIWQRKPEWSWLKDPLPNAAPVESALMRGLVLDPRLSVSRNYTPIDTIFESHSTMGLVGQVTNRESRELGRVVAVRWVNTVDKIDPAFASRGAVRTRVTVEIELLPEHDWRLLSYEMRGEYLNTGEELVGTYLSSTKIDYSNGTTSEPYRVTIFEDSTRGVFNTERVIRPLTDPEKASLYKLCHLSGFQLPEPEGLPADSNWWQYLMGFTACGILLFFGLRWYRSRSISS